MGCSASSKLINEEGSLKLPPSSTRIYDSNVQETSHSLVARSSLKKSSKSEKKYRSRKKHAMSRDIRYDKSTSSICTTNVEKRDTIERLQKKKNEKKEWTVKEIQSRKAILFRFLNNEIKYMHCLLSSDQEGEERKAILRQHFEFFFAFYYTIERIGPLPTAVLNKYRREAGKQLSRTKSVGVICKVVIDEWKECSKRQGTNAIKPPSQVMLTALSILWNFSDSSPDVTYDIIGEPKFLTALKEMLTSYFHDRIQGEDMNKGESKLIGISLSIVQILSTRDENITPLRKHGFVAIVSPYLDSKRMLDRFKSLAILANIIDENECAILQGKDDLLKMFLQTLKTALQTPSHRCSVDLEEWSAWECILTIQHLARNHANKKLLVEMGCLSHLVELAKIGIIEETRVALGAIWLLAFDKDNRKKILQEEELNIVDILLNLKKTSKDKESKDRADETLWLLREELKRNEKYKNKETKRNDEPTRVNFYLNRNTVQSDVKGGFTTGATGTRDKKGHIMISCDRNHGNELTKIKDKLKENGYSVWMDIDDMFGSVTQAVAEAVEFADVVLICMSKAYKSSVHCKHEADYAYQLQKKIVPLKMDADYVPNGWLGLIVAGKTMYDFSGKSAFENKFKDLLKELTSQFPEAVSKTKKSQGHWRCDCYINSD